MNRNFVILILAVNLLVLALGGFIVYYDLYLREYDRRHHVNTQVIEVEHYPLGYRPTYEYLESTHNQTVVTRGSWTLDFFQLSVLILAIIDVFWIYSKQKN